MQSASVLRGLKQAVGDTLPFDERLVLKDNVFWSLVGTSSS